MKQFLSLPAIGLILSLILANEIVSAQTFFTSEIKGTGKPMILIPGLYCSGEVWKETVERYQENYECHVLTLAGFGGNPANLNDHFLQSVKNDIINYIKDKKLKKPVIMGHSLGAFLAFSAASSAPRLFEKVIAVDGAPFMGALAFETATEESSKPMALTIKKSMTGQTPEQIYAYQKQILPSMITSSERIEQVAAIAMKGNSDTQAQVMYELFTTDLRPAVARINCPILALATWIGYKNYGATHDSSLKNYTNQLARAKNATVEISDTARHFIFYDDPTWFYDKVNAFLKK